MSTRCANIKKRGKLDSPVESNCTMLYAALGTASLGAVPDSAQHDTTAPDTAEPPNIINS